MPRIIKESKVLAFLRDLSFSGRIITSIFVLGFVLIGWYYFLYLPLQASVVSMHEQLKGIKQAFSLAEESSEQYAELQEQLKDLEAQLGTIQVFTSVHQAQQHLTTLLSDGSIELMSMQEGGSENIFTLSVTCEFEQLCNLLEKMRGTNVKIVSLSCRGGSGELQAADISFAVLNLEGNEVLA